MRRGTRLAALFAISLAACLPPTGTEGPRNRCEGDADCAVGVCNVELGMCVTAAREEPLQIALRVVTEDTGYAAEGFEASFAPAPIAGPMSRDLALPPPVRCTALVRDLRDGMPISADVVFRTESPIPGRAPTVRTPSARAELTGDESPYNLSTQLLPARRYTVEVQPTGQYARRLPPLRPVQPWMSPDVGETARLPEVLVAYPAPCSASQTEGCLSAIEGIVVDGDDRPLDGYVVVAVETATGNVISSISITGEDDLGEPAEAGTFSAAMDVRHAAAPESWYFRVTPSTALIEQSGPLPSFTVEPLSLFPGEMARIRAPRVDDFVLYEGTVRAATGTERWLEGATLRFVSTDIADITTNALGGYTVEATTDASGVFQVNLLPGTYDVTVTPSAGANAELAVLRETVNLSEATGVARGQSFVVPERTAFTGTVETRDGLGMNDAVVVARARSTSEGESLLGAVSTAARSNEVTTDANGLFELRLDVGLYDLAVVPPSGSNFPRTVRIDQAIGGAETTITDVFELQTPMTLTGRVTVDGAAAPPVTGGRVEAWAVIDDGAGGERAVLVGEAVIDGEGAYTLLLPSSL